MNAVKKDLIEFVEQLPENITSYQAAADEVRALAILKERIRHSEEYGTVPIEDVKKTMAEFHKQLREQA